MANNQERLVNLFNFFSLVYEIHFMERTLWTYLNKLTLF